MNGPINKISHEVSRIWREIKKTLASTEYLLGILLIIIGLVIIGIGLYHLAKIRLIEKWPIYRKAATILNSRLETRTVYTNYSVFFFSEGKYSLQYRVNVIFTYNWNKKVYIGTKLSYNIPWTSNLILATLEKNYYQKGKKVDLRINPKNPSEAYLTNKKSNIDWFLLIGFLILILGLYIAYLTYY